MEENLVKFCRDGKMLMLAFDHRGSFAKLMNPENPDSVSLEDRIALKHEIIQSVADQFTGTLVDVEVGLPALKGVTDKPFLLPIEKTGYRDVDGDRVGELEYEADQLKEMGASGVKLLVYFNPEYESAPGQLQMSREVIHDCMRAEMPSFVEIVTYLKEGEMDNAKREDLVLKSLKRYIENGVLPDVFKLQYPGSAQACKEVTKIIGKIPWIMLTGGDDFEEFKRQLQEAVDGGCIGFLAGRSLWKEATTLQGEERAHFVSDILPQRFREVSEICLKG